MLDDYILYININHLMVEFFNPEELTFNGYPANKEIDWEQRRFELVKAAMQGILARRLPANEDILVTCCIKYADAVIAKLKEG